MIVPQITARQAVERVTAGARLMVGGYLNNGRPDTLLKMQRLHGEGGLHLISNDAGFPGSQLYKLMVSGKVASLVASHIGMTPEVGNMIVAGRLEADLIPQGTLIERVRSGGAGLGGFLTPTGLGTPAQEGKRVIEVEGQAYLLELPLQADVAFIRASRADAYGNLWYHGSTRNMHVCMATAAACVVAEVDEIGEIDPDNVVVPGLFVDALVLRGNEG